MLLSYRSNAIWRSKESGLGKEGPAFAIKELVEDITVVVNLE